MVAADGDGGAATSAHSGNAFGDGLGPTSVAPTVAPSRSGIASFFGGGSVINIGSVVSSITPPASAVYTGTKGAVDAITGVLSKELGAKKIRVNALNPGMVETEGSVSAGFIGSDFEKNIITQTPLSRTGQPQDIASIAVFLASDDSAWVTGDLLRVGGGIY